ncbi:MAG TPA: hypothetical protein VJH65_02960 [Candidatus Nanoarchaeia archaeon]|nr:hypothetical protein [Candidatus Nanoarchaeia archaeon]
MEINEDISEKEYKSAYIRNTAFDTAQKALEGKKYRIISLRENAILRINQKDSDVSRTGNLVREGVIFVPKDGIYFTKNSPLLISAEEVVNAYRDNKEYYLSENQLEKALEKENSIKVSSNESEIIPTNRFGEEELTTWAFGPIAKKYGEFLKEAGVSKMPVRLILIGRTEIPPSITLKDFLDRQDKPCANQLYFCGILLESTLSNKGFLLGPRLHVRGISGKI